LRGLDQESQVIFASNNWSELNDESKDIIKENIRQLSFDSLTPKQLEKLDL
jgi:hypothetical protein